MFQEYLKKNPPIKKIDEKKINDRKYLISTILGNVKDINKDEQFNTLIHALGLMKITNPYLGGIITNICYRYQEKSEEREFIFPKIYELKESLDNNANFNEPVFARWLVSSSNTLATLALSKGHIDEAEKIIHRCLKINSLSSHTPLLYMNLCLMYFQLAMIYFHKGDLKSSSCIFEKCFYLTNSAINEIYNTRNEFLLSMKIDCDTLIELGNKSIIALNKLNIELEGSRVPKIKNKKNFSSKIALKRFQNLNSDWHDTIDFKINNSGILS